MYEHIHPGVIGYPYPGRSEYFPYSRPFNDYPDATGRGGILLPRGRSPFIPADMHDEKVCTCVHDLWSVFDRASPLGLVCEI